MITGKWGQPASPLLDLVAEPGGAVRGVVYPGRQNAPIHRGLFQLATGSVELEGQHVRGDGAVVPFWIGGRFENGRLLLRYSFGHLDGEMDVSRVEEHTQPRPSWVDRTNALRADVLRRYYSVSRPSARANARRLRRRNESLDSILCRDAVEADIPALADLHVTTWNATYRTSRGPTVATRTAQWKKVFDRASPQEFVLVLQDGRKRLIGFAFGAPTFGEFEGVLSKIFVRWDYHGLGLGRRLMEEAARRFLDGGVESFLLFAERSNPSIGFYDRMGGERLLNERGLFAGAYGWRDARRLLDAGAVRGRPSDGS